MRSARPRPHIHYHFPHRFILADTDRLHRKIEEMSDRIRSLEDALAILQSSITRETHPLLRRDLLDIKSGLQLHSALHSHPNPDTGEPQTPQQIDEESAHIDSFGTLAVRDDGVATFYGRSAGSEVSEEDLPFFQKTDVYSSSEPFTCEYQCAGLDMARLSSQCVDAYGSIRYLNADDMQPDILSCPSLIAGAAPGAFIMFLFLSLSH